MSFGDLDRGYQSSAGFNPSGRDGDREYLRLNDRVTSNIQQLSNNVASLSKFTGLLGTAKDTHELRDKIHDITNHTRDIIKDTEKDLKLLGKIDGGTQSEQKQRKLQQQKLSSDFREVLKRFFEVQKVSAQKEREYVAQAKKAQAIKQEALLPSDEESSEHKALVRDEQNRQRMAALENEIEFSEALIQEREEGIKEIEQTIHEVNEIFKDLGVMVKEQGDMLDTIEANIAEVENKTGGAATELTGASTYQKKARNKMCIILLILIIVVAIILLVVFLGN